MNRAISAIFRHTRRAAERGTHREEQHRQMCYRLRHRPGHGKKKSFLPMNLLEMDFLLDIVIFHWRAWTRRNGSVFSSPMNTGVFFLKLSLGHWDNQQSITTEAGINLYLVTMTCQHVGCLLNRSSVAVGAGLTVLLQSEHASKTRLVDLD